MGIIGNHKLNYANEDFKFPLGVQQYGTTWSEVQRKKFNRLIAIMGVSLA